MVIHTENSFNLQQDKLSIIFVCANVLSMCYVAFRGAVLYILHGAPGMVSTRGMPFQQRLLVISWPATFALLLTIRSMTHSLNNDCESLVPLSYFVRFSIHTILLVFQLRAMALVMRFRSLRHLMSQPLWLNRFNKYAFPLLMIPSVVLVALFYIFQAGIPLGGVCTLGNEDGKTGYFLRVHYWTWTAQLYELVFVCANIGVEYYLRGSNYMPKDKRAELLLATRISLAFLLLDTLFRFGIMKDFWHAVYQSQSSESYTKSVKATNITFATVYVGGMSSFLAHCYELQWVRFCGLTSPFQARFWRLLRGHEQLTADEVRFKHNLLMADDHTAALSQGFARSSQIDAQDPQRTAGGPLDEDAEISVSSISEMSDVRGARTSLAKPIGSGGLDGSDEESQLRAGGLPVDFSPQSD